MTNADHDFGKNTKEIEVTPEMLAAGLSAYLDRCPDTGVGDPSDRKMITEIFRPMEALRP